MAVTCIHSATHDWTGSSEPALGWGLMPRGADCGDLHPSLRISCTLEYAWKLGNCSQPRTSSSHRQAMLGLVTHISGTFTCQHANLHVAKCSTSLGEILLNHNWTPTDLLRLYQNICISYLHLSLLFLLSEKKIVIDNT